VNTTTFYRYQLRRDTAANWASANTILENGELGFDTTNVKIAIGDGFTTWASTESFITLSHPASYVYAAHSGQVVSAGVITQVVFIEDGGGDYLNEYDTNTGEFTAKYSGEYCVNALITFGQVAWGIADASCIYLYKNGIVDKIIAYHEMEEAVLTYKSLCGGASVILAAGDILSVHVSHTCDSGDLTLHSHPQYNWVSIKRF
jgi:hypothetical protein